MKNAQGYFDELKNNEQARKSLKNATADDIVKDAKSKGYDLDATEVSRMMEKGRGQGSGEMVGISIGWN